MGVIRYRTNPVVGPRRMYTFNKGRAQTLVMQMIELYEHTPQLRTDEFAQRFFHEVVQEAKRGGLAKHTVDPVRMVYDDMLQNVGIRSGELTGLELSDMLLDS